ncbi:hypothetical protein LZ32DRAFT_229455 [Colletotrichum eremochloae]|nr:hypothetical protein LZ32DRAFT_229455 [Colletotrichum eremochloae]
MVGNGWRRAVYVPDQRLCATSRKGEGGCQKSNRAEDYRCWAPAQPPNLRSAAVLAWCPSPLRERRRRERKRGRATGKQSLTSCATKTKTKQKGGTFNNGQRHVEKSHRVPKARAAALPCLTCYLPRYAAAHRSTDTLALLLRRNTYAKHTCIWDMMVGSVCQRRRTSVPTDWQISPLSLSTAT